MAGTDQLVGKLIALLKLVNVSEPSDPAAKLNSWSFLTGFPTGVGFEWYLSPRYSRVAREFATMAITLDEAVSGADIDSLVAMTSTFLKDHALDRELFNGDALFFRRVPTLLDARTISNEKVFAEHLWGKLRAAITSQMVSWLIAYPARRLHTQTHDLGFDGISLLRSDDEEAWKSVCAKFPSAKLWSPLTGARLNDRFTPHGKDPVRTWILCESNGVAERAKRLAARRIRTFVAILFAELHGSTKGLLMKSMARDQSMVTQFPSDERITKTAEIHSSIGTLLPPMVVDAHITAADFDRVRDWYTARRDASASLQQRATVASQFLHYAIAADDLERFLHFFITLDALFGVRGDVERSITSGIAAVFSGDPAWERRCNYLFDLRSELVHGGTSEVSLWSKLPEYYKHFDASPDDDATKAAMSSLRNYFSAAPAGL